MLSVFKQTQAAFADIYRRHHKALIASIILLLLTYGILFYDRQFIMRGDANKGILERFEYLLIGHLSCDKT